MPKRLGNEWHQTALYENSDGIIEDLDNVRLNKDLFPNLKWEDLPINVELCHKINYNEEHILQQVHFCTNNIVMRINQIYQNMKIF